jgi:hypothetical protein
MASPGVPPSVVDTASSDGFRFFAGGCADARREIGGGDAVACMRVGARDSRLDLHKGCNCPFSVTWTQYAACSIFLHIPRANRREGQVQNHIQDKAVDCIRKAAIIPTKCP